MTDHTSNEAKAPLPSHTDTTPNAAATFSTRYIPVTQWNDYHAWPPIGGLRHLIFHAESNGFDRVIKRCGRRVLIDEQAFFAWVESCHE